VRSTDSELSHLLELAAAHFCAQKGTAPAAIAISVPYLEVTFWGVPGVMGYFVLCFLAEGPGFTKPAMLIVTTVLLLKIPTNYILINGLFGLPQPVGVGCGYATAIVMRFRFVPYSDCTG